MGVLRNGFEEEKKEEEDRKVVVEREIAKKKMEWEQQQQQQEQQQEQQQQNGVMYVKVMTDEQMELLRRQISVYATICEQLVEMHKAITAQQDSISGTICEDIMIRRIADLENTSRGNVNETLQPATSAIIP